MVTARIPLSTLRHTCPYCYQENHEDAIRTLDARIERGESQNAQLARELAELSKLFSRLETQEQNEQKESAKQLTKANKEVTALRNEVKAATRAHNEVQAQLKHELKNEKLLNQLRAGQIGTVDEPLSPKLIRDGMSLIQSPLSPSCSPPPKAQCAA